MKDINITSKTSCSELKNYLEELREENNIQRSNAHQVRVNCDRANFHHQHIDAGNEKLAVRLKNLRGPPSFPEGGTVDLTESSWVEVISPPPAVEILPVAAIEEMPSSPAAEILPAETEENGEDSDGRWVCQ
uniref:Uncharacterized protein n=1 Tax=Parastrongyloides trichosuri TaxID=131310 RepID=A0A0N4Z435_PARTI